MGTSSPFSPGPAASRTFAAAITLGRRNPSIMTTRSRGGGRDGGRAITLRTPRGLPLLPPLRWLMHATTLSAPRHSMRR